MLIVYYSIVIIKTPNEIEDNYDQIHQWRYV